LEESWLTAALDRRTIDATEDALPPPGVMPDGFHLDPTDGKPSDDFLLPAFGDEEVTVVDDIVVTGKKPPYDHPYDDWWETDGPPPGDGGTGDWGDPGDGGFGGGGDQDPPSDRPAGWDACQDRAADALAAIAALALSLLPDIESREYGYIIYRDSNGDLQLSTLITGNNNYLTGLNPGSVPSDFGFQSWSQVVGIIHSHPVVRYREDGVEIRVHPDDNHHQPNARDWDWMDFWVAQGADDVNLRQYIYHGGRAHEFNYYNNRQGDGQRTNGAENSEATCG